MDQTGKQKKNKSKQQDKLLPLVFWQAPIISTDFIISVTLVVVVKVVFVTDWKIASEIFTSIVHNQQIVFLKRLLTIHFDSDLQLLDTMGEKKNQSC